MKRYEEEIDEESILVLIPEIKAIFRKAGFIFQSENWYEELDENKSIIVYPSLKEEIYPFYTYIAILKKLNNNFNDVGLPCSLSILNHSAGDFAFIVTID